MSLSLADAGVDEHLFLSECLEYFATYDQINLGESAGLECILRRYQLWEERYASRLRSSTEGGFGGASAERHLFTSGDRASGASLVAPLLTRSVADRMQEEAAVLKERRKGREERVLVDSAFGLAARPDGGGGGGGGSERVLTKKEKAKPRPMQQNRIDLFRASASKHRGKLIRGLGLLWLIGGASPACAVDSDQLAPRQALFPLPGIDTLPAGACLRPEWASAMIGTLNELGGHGKVERCGGVSAAQRSALGNVAELCNGVPDCPVDVTTKGAM